MVPIKNRDGTSKRVCNVLGPFAVRSAQDAFQDNMQFVKSVSKSLSRGLAAGGGGLATETVPRKEMEHEREKGAAIAKGRETERERGSQRNVPSANSLELQSQEPGARRQAPGANFSLKIIY